MPEYMPGFEIGLPSHGIDFIRYLNGVRPRASIAAAWLACP
jgi:hypothetical protein